MKNKTKIEISILIFIVLTLIFTLVFPKNVDAITGNSSTTQIRFSFGAIAENTSTSTFPQIRIFSDFVAANLTSNAIRKGRLSLLRDNLGPTTPLLEFPINNSFLNTPKINFTWSNSTDPNQLIDFDKLTYIIEIYNDSGLTEKYFVNNSISEKENTTEVNVAFPEDNLVVYWRIIVTDGNLNATTGMRLLGKDSIPPTNFTLTSPVNGTSTTDNTPALSWTPTNETNLENYTIEFSTSQEYTAPNFTEGSQLTEFSNWTTPLDGGNYFWKVIAYDKAGNFNESNQFSLAVSALTETVTETISTGEATARSGGTKIKPFNLDIISPPSVTIYSNDSVIVPLVITNPANQVSLEGIFLNVTADSDDVAPFLGATFIPILRPKEQRTVPLTIVTHTDPGAYGILIEANIVKPRFSDSVKIFANVIERDTQSQTKSSKQLIFAKDLFDGNPGCVELQEYIKQAEIAFNEGKFDKAFNLANSAIQSCKDLISFKELQKPTQISSYVTKVKDNKTILILSGETLAFILVILIAVKILRRKNEKF